MANLHAPRRFEHRQRLSTWLNVENGKAESLLAGLRLQSASKFNHLPIEVRETKHEFHDKVFTVEGELDAKPEGEFSVVFADWRLQHDTSTFTRVKIDGKEAASIKMDRDKKPLNHEPDYDREWEVSAYKGDKGEAFSFGPTAQGQIIVELHSVRAETGEEPPVFYRSIFRDPTYPEIQFLFPPSRPYATFIFNYHPPRPKVLRPPADGSGSEGPQSDDDGEKKEKKKRNLRPNRKRAIVENLTSDEDDEYEDPTEKRKKNGKGKGKRDVEPEEDEEMEEGEAPEETPARVDKGKGKAREEEQEEDQPETEEAPRRLKRGKDKKQAVPSADEMDEEEAEDFTPTKVAANKKKSKSKVAVKAPVKGKQGGGRGNGRKMSKATISSEDEEDDSGIGPVPEPMSEDEV